MISTWKHHRGEQSGIAWESWRSDVVEHGIVDERGRHVGHEAYIAPIDTAVGRKFRLYVRATRNGKKFGALPPSSTHDTLDEAHREACARIAAGRARYAKKYGGKYGNACHAKGGAR